MTLRVETQVVAQCEQLILAGVAGRVLALGREGEDVARTEDVAVRVDGARREDERRRRGARGRSASQSASTVNVGHRHRPCRTSDASRRG